MSGTTQSSAGSTARHVPFGALKRRRKVSLATLALHVLVQHDLHREFAVILVNITDRTGSRWTRVDSAGSMSRVYVERLYLRLPGPVGSLLGEWNERLTK